MEGHSRPAGFEELGGSCLAGVGLAMTTLFSGGFRRRKLGWVLLFLALVVVAGAPYAIWFFRHIGPEAEAARLMELLQLGPALTVAEIGAGKGEITVSLARRAGPAGHVFSTELDAARLSDIREAVSPGRAWQRHSDSRR